MPFPHSPSLFRRRQREQVTNSVGGRRVKMKNWAAAAADADGVKK